MLAEGLWLPFRIDEWPIRGAECILPAGSRENQGARLARGMIAHLR